MSSKLLLLLLFLFSAGCAPRLPASGAGGDRSALKRVQARLVALRGLEFKADVPIEVKSEAEMQRFFEQDLEEEYGRDGLRRKALAYAKLGLIPGGIDLKKSLLDFYGAQVVAFYDPRAKRLVMPKSLGRGGDNVGEMVLAHELTHALQDQHFSLGEKMGPSNDGDKDLALRAVIEGDATISGFGYMTGGVNREAMARISRGLADSLKETRSELREIPEAIVEEMMFQFYGGVAFVSRLLEERGWPAVDLAYASPPLSTEQVLHPEKYFSAPDPPIKIELRDLAALFPADWEEIENDVLGELMARVLFERFLSKEEANVIANGWGGDRFVAFSRGSEVAFIWASVWDSEKDAEEFFQGYQRLLGKKYPDGPSASAAYVERRGKRVIVVEGLEKNTIKQRVERIWQGMQATEEPFKSPFVPNVRSSPSSGEPIAP